MKDTQQLVDYVRWFNSHGGATWPGRPTGSPAQTLYPNLAAELQFVTIKTAAEIARVSPEVLAGAVEDGDALRPCELYRMTQYFNNWGPPYCSTSYLNSPKLSIVDPATNRGKYRRRMLRDAIEQSEPPSKWSTLYDIEYREAQDCLSRLDDGEIISYALWRRCYSKMKDFAPKSIYVRTERLHKEEETA